MLNNIQKRFLLFLFGCLGIRLFLVYLAKNLDNKLLPIMGYIFLIPAFGFSYIYLTNSRKTGTEVFGDKIWWNNLRPIHSILYFTFSYLAITNSKNAFVPLLIDWIIGLTSFLWYHYSSGNFSKLL